MNFSLFRVDKPSKLKLLSKNKINFFKKNEEISLFHFNQVAKNMFHFVLNISDVYQIGTKRMGNQHNFTYSSLINCFFFLDSDYLLIEKVTSEYESDVVKHISNKTKVKISKHFISNNQFLNVKLKLGGSIKNLEYYDEEEGDFFLDFVSEEKLKNIANNYEIEKITMLVEDEFISIFQKGKISVNNSDDQYLIKFTREIVDAIKNSN
ncbi:MULTISPECIES: hypothetical protein [Bacillus]|uniref:hypothetical protein n=1 Tax=Bacillus TaxID=1386 RepID=UPI002AAE90A0|nr:MULTISPECIES: hypothetical protein [Bacillus]MDY7430598.1 hypothetical protein [Bacillus sp. V26]MEC0765037.1 hypothetical protein [Bacillus atrophaeus]MEC0778292.1 hypothetical protein [Bacillus atrophaeus]MEC0808328.1 hypothetical protein [Bacillus atrophaeus]